MTREGNMCYNCRHYKGKCENTESPYYRQNTQPWFHCKFYEPPEIISALISLIPRQEPVWGKGGKRK